MEKDNKSLEKYQYEYFLKELETLSNYRAQFSNSRLLILGGAITLLIAVVEITDHDDVGQLVIAHLMIAGIMLTVIRMIASYSGAIYIFFDYIRALEKRFNLLGFSSAWDIYLRYSKSKNQFNATFSCFIACLVMLILSIIYMISTILEFYHKDIYLVDNFIYLEYVAPHFLACYIGYSSMYISFYAYLIFQVLKTLLPTKIYDKVKVIRESHYPCIKIKFANSDCEKDSIIEKFKSKIESTCKCIVLIVRLEYTENACAIVGFYEEELFKMLLINNSWKSAVDRELFKEIKKKSINTGNIRRLIALKLNNTFNYNANCFPPYIVKE